MVPANEIIKLSSQAFWDVDMNKLDYKKQADYIIRKVFEHGNWNDILEVSVFYGLEKIKTVLTSAKYLRENTLFFASLFLDTPRSQFKCYTTKQFHPVH